MMGTSLHAAADRAGVITFHRDRNVGHRIVFASDRPDRLRELIEVLGELGDGDVLLVPGMSEARSDAEAVRVLAAFADRVGGRL